jgi:cobalt-zinc-cadmium resistance protein CzcA
MIERLIRFSVHNCGVVFFLTAVIAGFGAWSFQRLPIDAVPDITNNQVQINTLVEGMTPEELERAVTIPVENVMGGLAGLTEKRSLTRFGISQVTLVFEDGIHLYHARQMVAERLREVGGEIPPDAQPKMGPVTTGLGEIVFYTVRASSPTADGPGRLTQLMDVGVLNDLRIKPRLLSVPGVAEIGMIGGYEKQYHVIPDVRKMARHGLHFRDLVEALKSVNRNAGGGAVDKDGERFLVRAEGLLKDPGDVLRVPVKTLRTLRTLTVGDVAEVHPVPATRVGAALVDGREELLGQVLMRVGENGRVVAHAVGEKLKEIKASLPSDVRVDVLYDRSEVVDATLRTVRHNLLTGAVLVAVVLFVLLGNVRAALITVFTIPLTLLATFIVMKKAGVSGNLMSLGALDFGIIVDGVVIVVDNCVRRLHERTHHLGRALTLEERRTTVEDATLEIRRSAGFGQLVILAVFLPVFGFTGVEGKMFIPMVAAFCAAVASAMVFSFFLAPALAAMFLTGHLEDREPALMGFIRRAYAATLPKALALRWPVVGLGAVAVILGGVLFSRLGGEFLPQLNEGSLVIQMVRPGNASLDAVIAMESKSEAVIRRFSQVKTVFSRIGAAEVATDPMPLSLADTFILFNERKTWAPLNGERPTKDDLAEAIVKALKEEVPGQETLLTQPIQMRFNELLEGSRADLSLKIYGDDLDTVAALTEKAQEIVEKIPGAGDVEPDVREKSPMLRVLPKRDYLRSLGASDREVLETVETAVGGTEAGFLYEGLRRVPLVVRLSEPARKDVKGLEDLPVSVGEGAVAPLSEVADVKIEPAHGTILREAGRRRASLLINIRGRDTESFVAEARSAVAKGLYLPEGYDLEWGGNFRNLQRAKARLALLTPLALLLVVLIVYAAFGSIAQTLLVFSGVPLALVGGVLGLMLNGLPFSVSAGVGFVALSGIAVLNGVVLVNVFNDLREKGQRGFDLLRHGTDMRLRPVLMTALVEIFGFLPMMVAHGVGAEVQRPLASVVIGGVVSSTLLTLVVLPVLVSLLERKIWR